MKEALKVQKIASWDMQIMKTSDNESTIVQNARH